MKFFLLFFCFSSVSLASDYQTEKVSDGVLIVVKTGNRVGSFILQNQQTNPDQAKYEWALFEINANNQIVELDTGSDTTGDKNIWILPISIADPINFGPFKLYWSGNKTGRGFLYFNYYSNNENMDYCIAWYGNLSDTQEALDDCKFKTVPTDA